MAYYFTSITSNYIPKARALCKSLKQYNHDARFVVALSDKMPDSLALDQEPFDHVIVTSQLEALGNANIFFFKHTVTEICTAVKPIVALEIAGRFNAERIVYLDPDIIVYSSLDELESLLDSYSIVLTPHQTEPESEDSYVRGNEILFLKRGTYNLGFFAVRTDGEGMRFLKWWKSRVELYCFDDDYEVLPELEKDGLLGLFTDQKWIDLVPAFFDRYYILKDPGYDVSTWNLTARAITKSADGEYLVNGTKLRFFHFSGYDSGGHHNEMARAIDFNPRNRIARELTTSYEKILEREGDKQFRGIEWAYRAYSNGTTIGKKERKLFHIRQDIYEYFPDPFLVDCTPSFHDWVRKEYSRYFASPELQSQFLRRQSLRLRWSRSRLIRLLFPYASRRRAIARSLYRWFTSDNTGREKAFEMHIHNTSPGSDNPDQTSSQGSI